MLCPSEPQKPSNFSLMSDILFPQQTRVSVKLNTPFSIRLLCFLISWRCFLNDLMFENVAVKHQLLRLAILSDIKKISFNLLYSEATFLFTQRALELKVPIKYKLLISFTLLSATYICPWLILQQQMWSIWQGVSSLWV